MRSFAVLLASAFALAAASPPSPEPPRSFPDRVRDSDLVVIGTLRAQRTPEGRPIPSRWTIEVESVHKGKSEEKNLSFRAEDVSGDADRNRGCLFLHARGAEGLRADSGAFVHFRDEAVAEIPGDGTVPIDVFYRRLFREIEAPGAWRTLSMENVPLAHALRGLRDSFGRACAAPGEILGSARSVTLKGDYTFDKALLAIESQASVRVSVGRDGVATVAPFEVAGAEIAWGEAAGGVRVGLSVEAKSFRTVEGIVLCVHVQNSGAGSATLRDGMRGLLDAGSPWTLLFAPKAGGSALGTFGTTWANPDDAPLVEGDLVLAPGETYRRRFSLRPRAIRFASESVLSNVYVRESASVPMPPPGAYAARLAFRDPNDPRRLRSGAVEMRSDSRLLAEPDAIARARAYLRQMDLEVGELRVDARTAGDFFRVRYRDRSGEIGYVLVNPESGEVSFPLER